MRWWLLFAVGCGGSSAMATPDAAVDAPVDVAAAGIVPECHKVPYSIFATGDAFGTTATKGSLAGWQADGRWFLTGVDMGGVSSFLFADDGATVDHLPGGIRNDDELFWRGADEVNGTQMLVAKRVTDRLPDGTFRAQRAVCGDSCTVCTAVMTRATHNAGEGEGDKLGLVGQLNDFSWGPGYTFNVRVLGTTAYLIRQDGLHVIDVADPTHPVELGRYYRSGGYSNDVKLVEAGAKRYAIIADYVSDVVDVTDGANPQLAATIKESAHTVAVEQRDGKVYAYFGNYDATCPVYDVTDPLHASKLGSYKTNGQLVHDLSVDNGIAYLNAWDAGFLVVDYTTPSAPVLKKSWGPTPTRTSHSNWTTTIGGRHIALHGEEAYGAKLDLVDLDTMQPFATWKTRDYVSIHNLMAFGSKAYFTYYQDGVRVLDLSDPTAPKQLGYYNTWDPQADYTTGDFFEGAVGLDVDLTRKLIFVADSPRGLLILRDDT